MNYKDIQKKSDQELTTLVKEQREALRGVRFTSTGMGSNDVKKVREAKQIIAWCLTEQNARRAQPTNQTAA